MTAHVPRFFIDDELLPGTELSLPEAAAHHLTRVLRLKEGDGLVLFNGRGGETGATIQSIAKKKVMVSLGTALDLDRASKIDVHLGLCVLKRDAMDRAITRCVELGIRELTPVISENCTVSGKVIADRHHHWHQIAIAACEQCGLNLIPEIHEAAAFSGWIDTVEADMKIVASPAGGGLPGTSAVNSAILLTGPEGGLTSAEESAASRAGYRPVRLGPRILRGENAPAVALSVIQQVWGDFTEPAR